MTELWNRLAAIAVAAAVLHPRLAVADHVPDNLSQDVDPNYIACLMAVDDAKEQFLDSLQNTCFRRMIEICSGRDFDAPSSQIIDCIRFETKRGIDFLQAAVAELPESVEKKDFFWRGYQRRRDSILVDVEAVKASPMPESIEVAIQQTFPMVTSAELLFYLARETGTPLEARVAATFVDH